MRTGQARRRNWNEDSIRSALHVIGVITIQISAPGCPDLLCYSKLEGFRLMEVEATGGRLTPAQVKFRQLVPFDVVRSVKEALAIYGVKA